MAVLAVTLLSLLASNDVGVKFLEENAKKEGVISLPSGLQYKVLRAGDGDSHPTASSSCECHYEGRTAQEYSKEPTGDTFDSSYARGSPTSFAPNQVIKGWTEAMQLMVEGDKWEMYIPSELGYGDSGSPPKIGGGDVLVFTMEIIKIKGAIKIAPPTRLSIGRAGLWLQLALDLPAWPPTSPRRRKGAGLEVRRQVARRLHGAGGQVRELEEEPRRRRHRGRDEAAAGHCRAKDGAEAGELARETPLAPHQAQGRALSSHRSPLASPSRDLASRPGAGVHKRPLK